MAIAAKEIAARFDETLFQHGMAPLYRNELKTLQINVGKLCNQACHHCHVDAGPKRTERMQTATAERILELLARSPSIEVVDITGGAPELNLNFRRLVAQSRALARHVIDRCNLTVLLELGQERLPEFLAAQSVEIIASLPCYTARNVDQQRGAGVFEKSIGALHRLNNLGYGRENSGLVLNLVYNPLGPSLPPPQAKLEGEYKRRLREDFGVEFNQLFTLTNMPISRFAAMLVRTRMIEEYRALLVNSFNAATVPQLMCRSLINVGWDGRLYDCDFNQMLEIEVPPRSDIWSLDSFEPLAQQPIATGRHCFGCTAGAGSSCGGSLQP